MLFEIKMAYALELIALVGGAFLVMKSCQAPDCHRRFGKIVGWFTVVFALLLMLCTTWSSYVVWKTADFCPHKAMGMKRRVLKSKIKILEQAGRQGRDVKVEEKVEIKATEEK
jgi:hypothetical protein